jgi:hypothetical protein
LTNDVLDRWILKGHVVHLDLGKQLGGDLWRAVTRHVQHSRQSIAGIYLAEGGELLAAHRLFKL